MGSFGDLQQAEDQSRQLRAAEAAVNVAGGPVWVALDVDQEYGRALFISRDIIVQKPFHEPGGTITWENCSLRKWLNESFFSSLPAQVRSRVMEGTSDRVFLLSIDEARKYFKSNADRVATFNGSTGWWWLRSPGYYQNYAACVDTDGTVNTFGYIACSVRHSGGVRPALWLNLEA